jgi:4a-hydroxytetrahydrobiopterin dehydratase
MVEVTLYTRKNCPLCESAKYAIAAAGMTPRLVDVDDDPELLRRFTNDVPVIYVDGVEAFRHRVTSEAFLHYLKSRRSSMAGLSAERCVPCRGGVPPLKGAELGELSRELEPGWRVVDEHHLEREFAFPDFAAALDLTNRIGALAEEEGHHPDIYLAWGKVRVTIWTHKIDGLTRSDFVLAAKIDAIPAPDRAARA